MRFHGDYRMIFTPDTAARRLAYWQALQASLDAADVIGALGGMDSDSIDPVRLAFEGVVFQQISLAKAQLARAADEGVTT